MIKDGIRIVKKKSLAYIAEEGNNIKRFKPWLGDSFSFLYDFIMEKSIFPKKFAGDMNRHNKILLEILKDVREQNVLELATGSGSAVHFLNKSNPYTGTDISPGLLKRAVKNFRAAGFKQAEFFVTSAENLPFADQTFSTCLCILSLNFFSDIPKVFHEINRIMLPNGVLFCSVPVPERNKVKSPIRGRLYSEEEWGGICQKTGFRFFSFPEKNGALLYFKAVKEKENKNAGPEIS